VIRSFLIQFDWTFCLEVCRDLRAPGTAIGRLDIVQSHKVERRAWLNQKLFGTIFGFSLSLPYPLNDLVPVSLATCRGLAARFSSDACDAPLRPSVLLGANAR
jgi:hypothetical protein